MTANKKDQATIAQEVFLSRIEPLEGRSLALVTIFARIIEQAFPDAQVQLLQVEWDKHLQDIKLRLESHPMSDGEQWQLMGEGQVYERLLQELRAPKK